MLDTQERSELAALLDWYREMGVDRGGRRGGHRLAGQRAMRAPGHELPASARGKPAPRQPS